MHRFTQRGLGAVIGSVAAVALLAGCAGGAAAGGDVDTSTITVAQPADLTTIDPVIDNGLFSTNVFHALYDQLTVVEGDGSLSPRLATEWIGSEDAKSWTFTLRDDATFHNGEPITAEDVIFSFQAVKDNPKSLNRIYTNNIASMESAAENEVTFTLTNPDATFPRFVYYISIVPEAVYTELGADGFAAAPVGSGPYQYVSWTPGVSVVLKSNPDYWGGEPAIENVIVEPVADAEARLNGLLSGDIDLTALAPAQLSAAQSAAGYRVEERASNQLVYLGANESNEFLADEDFREAISLAVDRETIISTVYDDLAVPANASSVAPDVAGHDADGAETSYDPEAAAELVEASGYDGTPIPFEYATDGSVPMSNELAQAVAGQLEAVGIITELSGTDTASFNISWTSKQLKGLYLQQFSPSMMDAATTMNYLYGPTGQALFSDPDVDALIAQAASTVDEAARMDVIGELWELNSQRHHLVNLQYSTAIYGVNDAIDWEPRADGHVDFRTAFFK